jgi:hypothetical protein
MIERVDILIIRFSYKILVNDGYDEKVRNVWIKIQELLLHNFWIKFYLVVLVLLKFLIFYL